MALLSCHGIQPTVSHGNTQRLRTIWNKWFKFVAGLAIGAVAGYAYYHFIGCHSGTCPLTSNPWVTTLYGMLLGGITTFPSRSKRERRNERA